MLLGWLLPPARQPHDPAQPQTRVLGWAQHRPSCRSLRGSRLDARHRTDARAVAGGLSAPASSKRHGAPAIAATPRPSLRHRTGSRLAGDAHRRPRGCRSDSDPRPSGRGRPKLMSAANARKSPSRSCTPCPIHLYVITYASVATRTLTATTSRCYAATDGGRPRTRPAICCRFLRRGCDSSTSGGPRGGLPAWAPGCYSLSRSLSAGDRARAGVPLVLPSFASAGGSVRGSSSCARSRSRFRRPPER
jgi:hypothetical protein